MIGKTSIGRSFKGCCAYNMQKVEQGKGEILMAQGVRDFDQRAMVADFVRQAQMNPDLSRSVWHTAISFDPQDETRLRANPQLMQQVASDYLNGMGLDQSQYVVIRHRDTDHSHFHIIANRVASDGQTVSDSHNYSRSEKLLRQIEQKHQLTPMQEQSHRQKIDHLPEGDRSRIELRDQVRASLSRCADSRELREELSRHGIRLIVNKGEQGQTRGLTFEKTRTKDNGEEETLSVFKGSKLHQSLGLKQIQAQLAQNLTLRQQEEKKRVQPRKWRTPRKSNKNS
jgi:hypothetical protein